MASKYNRGSILQALTWMIFMFFALDSVAALPVTGEARSLDKVTLQLKWSHAFQFAGYYAAKEKGYYREAGLYVEIVEATPGVDPVKEVVEGRAQFGVGTSSLLIQRNEGKPLVALAVIFQHSPYVLLTRQDKIIRSVHDLLGKRLMIEPQAEEILAYLHSENVPLSKITLVEHSFDYRDLIKGDVDAISAYVTNQPYYLDRIGFPYQSYSPRSAGIDFYGDNLFTSEKEIAAAPDRVKAFLEASLRGWRYAMANQEEIAALILSKYSRQNGRGYLLFEAQQMMSLINPELIEIGYMNPGRWRHIAETYAELGMLPRDFSFNGFLYNINPQRKLTWFYISLTAALLLIVIVSAVAWRFALLSMALRESEARFRSYFELPLIGIAITSPTKGWLEVNDRLCAMLGYSKQELARLTWSEMTYPEDLEPDVKQFEQMIAGKIDNYSMEKRFIRKGGQILWISMSVGCVRKHERTVDYVIALLQDITEHKLLEDRLRQSEKMEAIGQLAGGIAHDFNNQLAGIMGYAEMLVNSLDAKDLKDYAENILRASKHSAALTRELLAFSRKGKFLLVPVHVHKVIGEVVSILEHSIDKRVEIKVAFNASPALIMGDPSQLQNALLNLAINARDAMPDGGELCFTTETLALEDSPLNHELAQCISGRCLKISVSDNGVGMDSELLKHIFEPFFTTKEKGKGVGMGLASVYGTVQNHHGAINVSSKPGCGTVFFLYFPLSEDIREQANSVNEAVAMDELSKSITNGLDGRKGDW